MKPQVNIQENLAHRQNNQSNKIKKYFKNSLTYEPYFYMINMSIFLILKKCISKNAIDVKMNDANVTSS